MDEMKAIDEYPDISFIENYTLSQLNEDMLNWYKEKKKEETGKDITLPAGDERRLLLTACAYYLYQGYMFIDDAGKMGLLKYARGMYLDNLGAMKKVPRNPTRGATVTLKFKITESRDFATGIPEGTRATAGNNLYFATTEYGEILPGETSAEITAVCTTTGVAGNYFGIGEINQMVDAVPFISGVENVTVPENGQDTEEDDSYRLRIYLAPAGYSNAGSEDGYRFFVLSFNPNISDIRVTSPEECEIHICYLLEDGRIPGEESLKALKEYLEEETRKPITDRVVVYAPVTKDYELELRYYINQSESSQAVRIQNGVTQAIEDYLLWQSCKIGRDINPDELICRIKSAGAKRVEITAPVFTVVSDNQVAKCIKKTVNYGGLERD